MSSVLTPHANSAPTGRSGEADPECVAVRGQLLAAAGELELPPGALDCLLDELGGKKAVAEMTGRKNRMIRSADGRRFVLGARRGELDQCRPIAPRPPVLSVPHPPARSTRLLASS